MRKSIFFGLFCFFLLTACSSVGKETLNQIIKDAQKPWNASLWWKDFHDPLLNQFANQLIAQNLDIQVAAARLAEARASSTQVIAGLYPDISYTLLESRLKNQFFPQPQNVGLNGMLVNWELDIFGQTRAGIKSAEAHAWNKAANIDDIRNLVLADLAKAVIDWRQAQYIIKQTKKLLKAEDEQIHLFEHRNRIGLIDASFAERSRAERAQTLTKIPLAIVSAKVAEYQIERLLGDTNNQVSKTLLHATPVELILPQPDKVMKISLRIIKNRPDVRKARFDLLAAQADLLKAEANLWPKMSVYAFFGIENGRLGASAFGNPVWAVASLLTAPMINFGRLRGAVNEKDAGAKANELIYENTILLALQETKTALSDYLNGLNVVKAQANAVKRRQATLEITRERFKRGLTDKLDVTTAQSDLVQATLTLIANKTSNAEAYIRLQKALGLSISVEIPAKKNMNS